MKNKNLVITGSGLYLLRFINILAKKKNIKISGIIPRLDHEESEVFLKSIKKLKKKFSFKILYLKKINSNKSILEINKLKPHLICNWGHNQLFKDKILNLPQLGCVNLHPGLLPFGRGSGAIQGEILNGRKIGWTCHFMDKKFDNGEIISYFKKNLDYDNLYYDEIKKKIFKDVDKFYAKCVMKILNKKKMKKNKIKSKNFGCYYPKFSLGDDVVDWNDDSKTILRKIKSRSPEKLSVIYISSIDKKFYIKKVSSSKVNNYKFVNGQVIDNDSKYGTLVKTNDNAIWINEGSYNKKKFSTPKFKIGTNFFCNSSGTTLDLLERINFLEKKISKLNIK